MVKLILCILYNKKNNFKKPTNVLPFFFCTINTFYSLCVELFIKENIWKYYICILLG